eukprot:181388-Chlamydomonas_euryale.AAC.2
MVLEKGRLFAAACAADADPHVHDDAQHLYDRKLTFILSDHDDNGVPDSWILFRLTTTTTGSLTAVHGRSSVIQASRAAPASH